MRGRTLAAAISALALGVGLAACGSSDDNNSTSTSGGGGGAGTVDLYSSLPLQGASKDQTAAMVNGIRLAMSEAGNKAGETTVKYTSLDDSTAQAGNWDPGQTAQNARKVAQDSKAVGYIGEFNSGASAISIPILNQAGIPQVSPANTYVGLTTNEPGSEKGEPQKYYPSGKRTYLRIVPRDTIQAAALLTLMKQDGCTKVAIANDKETYGAGLARLVQLQSKKVGVDIVSNESIDKTASNYRSYASGVKAKGADCFLFSGVTANGAVQLYKDVAAALPNAKLYGPDGVAEEAFTNPKKGGIPADVGKRTKVTVATLGLSEFKKRKNAVAEKFFKDFEAETGDSTPDPYAIYGYETMSLALDTLKKAGAKANDRATVAKSLLSTKGRQSVLGTYDINKDGDTSITDYGLYVIKDGVPTFSKVIKAP